MAYYWVTFEDHKPGTIEGAGEDDARERAAAFGTVESIGTLPHPAVPKLDVRTDWPAFCRYPHLCQGTRSCRREFACDD